MDARELRIGNFINYNYLGVIIVSMIESGEDITQSSSNEYSPIPLTEEWLLKFGFNHSGNGFYKHIKSLIGLANIGDKYFHVGFRGNSLCDVKYVHHFQNLFFTLTGEDLTIKK